MNKNLYLSLTVVTLLLSACSGQPSASQNGVSEPSAATQIAEIVNTSQPAPAPTQANASETPSASVELNADYENAVSIEMQILLGTFKLEGTENAISKEQAATLLPLWMNFKTINESIQPARGEPGQGGRRSGQGQPNATPQAPAIDPEIQTQFTELVEQIQAVLTPAQVQAITEMKITRETAQTVLQEQGLRAGDPQQGAGNNPGSGQPPSGGGQPGKPPSGGNGLNFLPNELLEALLQLLQNKIG